MIPPSFCTAHNRAGCIYQTRADGWPLCPCCGEDELWSPFVWDGTDPKPPMQAWIGAGLRCYWCAWDSTSGGVLENPPPRVSSTRVPSRASLG